MRRKPIEVAQCYLMGEGWDPIEVAQGYLIERKWGGGSLHDHLAVVSRGPPSARTSCRRPASRHGHPFFAFSNPLAPRKGGKGKKEDREDHIIISQHCEKRVGLFHIGCNGQDCQEPLPV